MQAVYCSPGGRVTDPMRDTDLTHLSTLLTTLRGPHCSSLGAHPAWLIMAHHSRNIPHHGSSFKGGSIYSPAPTLSACQRSQGSTLSRSCLLRGRQDRHTTHLSVSFSLCLCIPGFLYPSLSVFEPSTFLPTHLFPPDHPLNSQRDHVTSTPHDLTLPNSCTIPNPPSPATT